MTFEKFKELTDLMVKSSTKVQNAYQLGIDIYEFIEEKEALVHRLWNTILTDFGLEWFSWFMYEKNYIHDGVGRADLTAHDNGTPICEDLEGLYEYLVKNNYFKITIEDAKSAN